MAIDIFREGDDRRTAQPRFSLEQGSHETLHDQVWSAVERRAGVYVDPYGSTVLERTHIELVVSLMELSFKAHRPNQNQAELLRFLKAELSGGVNALIFFGD